MSQSGRKRFFLKKEAKTFAVGVGCGGLRGVRGAAVYFGLMRGALGGLVDGAHFFDAVADDVVYEVLYEFPGWPRVVRGRDALMARFRGYGDVIRLHAADRLVTHVAEGGRVLVIEYEVHGTVLGTGRAYDNRFCSIITVAERRVSHWRDYMDSLAAWRVLVVGRGVRALIIFDALTEIPACPTACRLQHCHSIGLLIGRQFANIKGKFDWALVPSLLWSASE